MIEDDYLIILMCDACGHDNEFPLGSPPGGHEYCGYCEECAVPLVQAPPLWTEQGGVVIDVQYQDEEGEG